MSRLTLLRHSLFCGLVVALSLAPALYGVEYEAKPAGAAFEKFQPLKAPVPGPLLIKTGDCLAICGDSITEQKKYGENYALAGNDGVHPQWAGHLVMAYAYLRAMGLDGNLGTITVDLAAKKAMATEGHVVDSFANNEAIITSHRYPFCATGAVDSQDSLRSDMSLVPFNQELNRLRLVVTGATAANYSVTWGTESRTYTAAQLTQGINLAEDFQVNPFSEAFSKVQKAVLAKQTFETEQVQKIFHGAEGKQDMETAVKRTEAVRSPLAAAIASARVPVTHHVRIEIKE